MSEAAMRKPRFSPSDAVFAAFERGRVPTARMGRTFWLFMLAMLAVTAPGALLLRLDLLTGFNTALPQYSFLYTQGFGGLLGLLAWPVIAAAEASLLRGMLGPAGGSTARDAMILLVTYIVILLLMYGAMIVSMIPVILLMIAVIAVAAVAGADPASPAAAFIPLALVFILFAAMMAGTVYVLLRLSLAQALSVADGKLRIFESWRMTRGSLWRLFGAHFLRCVFMMLGWAVVSAIAVVAGFILLRGEVFPSFEAFFEGAPLPMRAVNVSAAIYAVATVPLAALYFIDTAMRVGIGASFLRFRGRVTPE